MLLTLSDFCSDDDVDQPYCARARGSEKARGFGYSRKLNILRGCDIEAMLTTHPSYNPFSTEIWAQIAWQVDEVKDLLALSATCRFLRLLCTDDQLWKQLCIEHYAVDYACSSFFDQYKACLQDKSMRRVCRHLMGFTNPVLLEKSSLYKTMSLNFPCSKCRALCPELYMCMHRKCDEARKYFFDLLTGVICLHRLPNLKFHSVLWLP